MPTSQFYTMKEVLSPFAPEEQKQWAWKELKRRAGQGLYELLEKSINPTVVELIEHIEVCAIPQDTTNWMGMELHDELRIEVVLTPVISRYAEIHRNSDYDWYKFPIGYYNWTFWNRLRWVITGRLPK